MKLKEISSKLYDERELKSLTGATVEQFNLVLPLFEEVLIEYQQKQKKENKYQDKNRKSGSGRKSKLERPVDYLFFVLFYLKCYPTFDLLGFSFNMNRSSAFEHVNYLFLVLHETLYRLEVLPKTSFATPEEMQLAFAGIDTLLIDATERPINRPQDNEKQKDHFSGKKRQHTYKNTVIATLDCMILYVGLTFSGKNHDYGMFKKEFTTGLDWFSRFNVFVDLGYKGIDTDYTIKHCSIPHKKPKKSKNNPHTELTKKQKKENREMSRQRVIVEHAIGGMKRYKCLVNKFRNRIENIEQVVIVLAAGLWNLNISTR